MVRWWEVVPLELDNSAALRWEMQVHTFKAMSRTAAKGVAMLKMVAVCDPNAAAIPATCPIMLILGSQTRSVTSTLDSCSRREVGVSERASSGGQGWNGDLNRLKQRWARLILTVARMARQHMGPSPATTAHHFFDAFSKAATVELPGRALRKKKDDGCSQRCSSGAFSVSCTGNLSRRPRGPHPVPLAEH